MQMCAIGKMAPQLASEQKRGLSEGTLAREHWRNEVQYNPIQFYPLVKCNANRLKLGA